MAAIIGEQGQTCAIGEDNDIPCAFSAAGGVGLGLFMEQDTSQARVLIAVADLPTAYADPQDAVDKLLTGPDGVEYRITRQSQDGHSGAVLFTLVDPTGAVGE